MILYRLAFKNIYGAGLRTWLNVVALSFSFVAIIYMQGLYNGMRDQMENVSIDVQYAGGHYWHQSYDPYDPLTLDDAHGRAPADLQKLVKGEKAMPILVRRGIIYPHGRFQNILLKGISPEQNIVTMPTHVLKNGGGAIPALIGERMAKSAGLAKGDQVMVSWRDARGTFDAREIEIAGIMRTDVSDIDNGQLWIPIETMREMMAMPHEATIIVLEKGSLFDETIEQWEHKDLTFLMKDIRALFLSKSIGGSILYITLLLLAMLAIFDTQILSIFKRRKEMGTMMALGMTRSKIIQLFTLEGTLHAVLAVLVAALYGIPLLIYAARTGFGLPEVADSFGMSLGSRIYPAFTAGLVVGTILLVLMATTIVSYLPTRKIAKLKPTDALRGKMT